MDLSDKEWNIVRTVLIIALLIVGVFVFSARNYLNEKNLVAVFDNGRVHLKPKCAVIK